MSGVVVVVVKEVFGGGSRWVVVSVLGLRLERSVGRSVVEQERQR